MPIAAETFLGEIKGSVEDVFRVGRQGGFSEAEKPGISHRFARSLS